MSVRIRLTRLGKKDQPIYRVIAIDSQKKREGKFIEILGHYNPQTKPHTFKLKKDRYNYWLSKGAQPSDTVRNLAK